MGILQAKESLSRLTQLSLLIDKQESRRMITSCEHEWRLGDGVFLYQLRERNI